MAKMNYEHVYAAAGFSGDSWDIAVGYNLTFTSAVGAVSFDNATKKITLASGTFPTWLVAGKVFYTDSVTNPGPFTVKIRNSGTDITLFETPVNELLVTATLIGSADTKIQDVLLSAGNGILTTDAPLVLVSTGALTAPRTLSISALESESVDQGSEPLRGRFFFLSVQNTDVGTNSITISSSATINGSATFVISSTGEYMFYHIANGLWRAVVLPLPTERLATIARIPFADYKWDEGTTKDTITILQTGSPSLGEVGPHSLTLASSYIVQVINTDLTPDELVDVEVQYATSGNIVLRKAAKAQDFNGVAIIVGALD